MEMVTSISVILSLKPSSTESKWNIFIEMWKFALLSLWMPRLFVRYEINTVNEEYDDDIENCKYLHIVIYSSN